jgi:hypothetical protein
MIADAPLASFRNFHEILTNTLLDSGPFGFFREDLVNFGESELSMVCYHIRRGRGMCRVSLFLRFAENSPAAYCSRTAFPLRKEMGVPHFTEDTLQRIMMNPFYAITVARQLTREHEPPMGEAEWVQANTSLMRERGSERWLRQLLDVLEGKVGAPDGPINPFQAINIDPLFAAEHPPLIGREMWVEVNVMQIRNMGAEAWLRQLLDVLNGDIVTAEEVGFAPPGGQFGYAVPGTYNAQRRGKKKRKKRRHR